mmetsp:Transcript_22263/g.50355  ORF Transcript_22263/g.50355 Transcript_22263/m.50355 type:complete len:220 (-) Transcript_22263:214-873(-)|eukprot:CAMPEP_0172634084 /NCGR_PEP_ID=MMETSP1068-20121228/192786_1 /TAXON_ID=35684 /ORGANISM="Pseudopedinella elastica, Strain CCMP716" /LENGTH=219 /DNA_ID=CAMNT_0013445945 /DNA_START=53 /DNA_END=712 /DNA_ORIENTATION=-
MPLLETLSIEASFTRRYLVRSLVSRVLRETSSSELLALGCVGKAGVRPEEPVEKCREGGAVSGAAQEILSSKSGLRRRPLPVLPADLWFGEIKAFMTYDDVRALIDVETLCSDSIEKIRCAWASERLRKAVLLACDFLSLADIGNVMEGLVGTNDENGVFAKGLAEISARRMRSRRNASGTRWFHFTDLYQFGTGEDGEYQIEFGIPQDLPAEDERTPT